MKNNFAKNLKFLRKYKNLSQNDLANKVSLTRQTISNYEKGLRQPDLFALTKISNFFSISIDELIYSNSSIELKTLNTFKEIDNILNKNYCPNDKNSILELLTKKQLEVKNNINILNNELDDINYFIKYLNDKDIENKNEFSEELSPYIPSNNIIDLDFYSKTKVIKSISLYDLKDNEDYLKLPCIGNVSAGYPMYACEDIERYFYIPKEYIKHSEDEYFILRIKGESMNKIYKNGDYVLVHKTCCIDENKPSVVLVNNDEATVKYVMLDDEYFYLQPYSDNPKFQENIRYKSDENTLNIVGTVIGVVFEEEK